jgi:phosphate transport system protein
MSVSKHMHDQIARVTQQMIELTSVVQSAVAEAVQAVVHRDPQLAQRVIDRDVAIDKAVVDIEEECLKLLALYQPVATDLRYIVAVLKINDDIERVGDLAVNTAERALFLCRMPPIEPPSDLTEMSRRALSMLSGSLEALMHQDAQRARAVRAMDDDVDARNREMHVKMTAAVRRDPEQVEQLLNYLSVSRYLERVADCAANVAEDVIYLVEGEIVRHKPSVSGS